MENKNLILSVLIILLLILTVSSVMAEEFDYEGACPETYQYYNGTHYCIAYNPIPFYLEGCDPGVTMVYSTFLGEGLMSPLICGAPSFGAQTGQTLEQKGVCKFTEINNGYVGGRISASGFGSPSILRLVNDDKIYKLPVIENTIIRDDGTGNWTAEFPTIDFTTGQPLVPTGQYDVHCFGGNGTADGGGNFTLEITR